MDERLKKQLEFLLEIDKSKNVGRQTYLSDGMRKENDAEHSWHLAVMAILLSEYANEDIDVLKTVAMVLIHDLVEIDAGDTYAYDSEGNKTKQEREIKAADRIFNILPEDQAKKMRALWDEFEKRETPEAKFAAALDRTQPVMLTNKQGGKSWLEHEVKKSQITKRTETVKEGSKELYGFVSEAIDKNVKN
ncbi:MAG: HD domain-containing protein, partial [Lachnospiraceae bacterium]|nr:HD domain-containing protein [Lachnospiraceae bacterium]